MNPDRRQTRFGNPGDVEEIVVLAENALYENDDVENSDNVAGALDNILGRVKTLEEGEGGSDVVISGSTTPLTNNDKVAFDIQRVFTKNSFVAASGWDIKLENFIADEAVAFTPGDNFTLYIEAQAGTESLGANAITNISMSLFYRTHFNGLSWNHVWDGTKDIYYITAPNAWTSSGSSSVFGIFAFGLHGANGKNLKISAYADYNGKRFYCKTCSYSADSSTLEAMSYRLEWPETATTVDKIGALVDNHQIPFCSAGSEYDPFMAVNTTPRVIVTIVSDDGEIHDYTNLHPYLKGMAETNGVDIRWSVAIPSNFIVFDETTRPVASGSDRMTARMIRELVGKYGVSVLCHNYNHEVIKNGAGTISLTAAEQENIFTKARRQIEREIGVPCIHHCLPGGGSNTATWSELPKQFLSTALVEAGINIPADLASKSGYSGNSSNDNNRMKICRYAIASNTVSTYTGYIDTAISMVSNNNRSAWVVFCTHGQEWNAYNTSIKGITEYCITNGIAMRNYSEAYAEIYPAKDRLKQILGIS